MTNALLIAAAALGATAMLCLSGLRAWRGWLELRRLELARPERGPCDGETDDVATRIELADVKERLRKLEAIASVVEL